MRLGLSAGSAGAYKLTGGEGIGDLCGIVEFSAMNPVAGSCDGLKRSNTALRFPPGRHAWHGRADAPASRGKLRNLDVTVQASRCKV